MKIVKVCGNLVAGYAGAVILVLAYLELGMISYEAHKHQVGPGAVVDHHRRKASFGWKLIGKD